MGSLGGWFVWCVALLHFLSPLELPPLPGVLSVDTFYLFRSTHTQD